MKRRIDGIIYYMAAKKTSEYPAKRKRLTQELSDGKLYPAYLIYGEEDYLRAQNGRFLLEQLGAREGDMNFTRFAGDHLSADEVIETAMTLPFFAPHRVLLIEESGWFAAKKRKGAGETAEAEAGDGAEEAPSGGEEGKKLAAYLKDPAATAHLVFLESSVNRTMTLFKAIEKTGFALSCDPPSEEQLMKWIGSRLAANGLQVEQQAAARLLALCAGDAGNETRADMRRLETEMEKLIAYCYGRDAVRLADVDAICSDTVNDRVFRMVDLMADRNRQGAMALYEDMLAMKQAPLRILALIVRQFNIILQAAELSAAHRAQGEIAAMLGVHPYYMRKYMAWAGSFSRDRLTEILGACAARETDIKRGRMTDKIAVESLIAAYSGGEKA